MQRVKDGQLAQLTDKNDRLVKDMVGNALLVQHAEPNSDRRPSNVYLEGITITESALRSCWRAPGVERTLPAGMPPPVVFFDLDNTLYSKQTGIAEEMGNRIQLFFQQFLHLPEAESQELGRRYYLDYGLAIKGLLTNFQIDPEEYDKFVDGGLQLERVLRPDKRLVEMLEAVQARRWIFTNAGLYHAQRVLRLLGIDHLFEGIVYCNYCEPNFPAKPDRLAYERAMICAGVAGRPDLCYFVDDSANNVRTAREIGWNAVCFDEQPEDGGRDQYISSLLQLPTMYPEIFRT